MNVRQILDRPEREWDVKPPASEVEIALLESKARAELPTEYLELLRFSNGGEGPLALPPLWFQLYPVNDCINLCHSNQHVLEQFPTFMFFGSNVGLSPSHSTYAWDRRGALWRSIRLRGQVAGGGRAMEIAPSMGAVIESNGPEG